MIKMRIENDEKVNCNECGVNYKNTEEMYEIAIFDSRNFICKGCCDKLFSKLLKADCMYNGKIKSKNDLARQERARKVRSRAEKKL